MTFIERPGADKRGPEKSGPEKYAPPDQRDVAFLRRQRSEGEPAGDQTTENMNALIGRVSGVSIDEIDRVIRELESVREMLRNEGERVSREIAGYASLSHESMTAMKVIADSLKQWKDAPHKSGY